MNHLQQFDAALTQCPLVAILRGVQPSEVSAIGEVLVAAGFRLIEVPLNSPEALTSIATLVRTCGEKVVIAAGTVLSVENVQRVREAGATMIVSPDMDPRVIAASVREGLVSLPGIFTVTEAFAAIDAGATALNFFPAEAGQPAALKAMQAVLPFGTRVLPVGGISAQNMAQWWASGAAGFGLGSSLFKPGMTPDEVSRKARVFVEALGKATSTGAFPAS